MNDMPKDVVNNCVIGKVCVSAIVSNHKEAPHIKAANVPVDKCAKILQENRHFFPHRTIIQPVDDENRSNCHAIIQNHVESRPKQRLVESFWGNAFLQISELKRFWRRNLL